MIELKKYEWWSNFEAEPYTNWVLSNSLKAIWERKTETEKKIAMILYYARISKVRDPDILKNYVYANGIDRIAKIDEQKKIDEMIEYFKKDSWEALKENSLNNLQKAPLSKRNQEKID